MQGKKPKGPTPPKAVVEVMKAFEDHATFCRESLAIRDKYGKTVAFELQPAQKKLHRIIQRCRELRRPVRVIALKARQVMVSSGFAAEAFHVVPFIPGQRCAVVAHQDDNAKAVFDYYHQFLENYVPFRGVAHLPELVKDAEDAGIIEWANGSRIEVQTANNVKVGRGKSLRILHLSEYAFWRDARTLMTGLMQCVPDDPDTMVVIESTANGFGGDFYLRWNEANDPSSNSEWSPFFFAWWEHPEYTRSVEDPRAFERTVTEEELELQKRYNLTLGQLAWRRWAIKNKCDNSVDAFKQEYPSCPEEAFLFSGRPRFNHQCLSRMPIDHEGLVGELEELQQGPHKVQHFLPNGDRRGALTVYRKPAPHKRYVIGVDVAEGIDVGKGVIGSIDPDYSVADVLDRDTGEQVAQVRGRIEPGPFGRYVAALGRWYHNAFVVPETNGPGLAFLDALLGAGYPPGCVYHRRPAPDEQFSTDAGSVVTKIGWKTSAITRVHLLSILDQCIRDFSVIVRNPGTLQELITFVHKANGRQEAMDSAHDDRVISLGLGCVGLLHPPADDRPKQTERFVNPDSRLAHDRDSRAVQRYGERRSPDRGELIRL